MRRVLKLLFWTLVFGVLLVGMDQLLTRIPPVHPAHAAISEFYRDFKTRLFSLIVTPGEKEPQTVEAIIEQEQRAAGGTSPATVTAKPPAKASGGGFVYADAQGVLQFADALEEIPEEYRDSAEPLGK